MFLYKNQFLLIFSFLSIPIELLESTAAIFRKSAGYVFNCALTKLNYLDRLIRDKIVKTRATEV